jgi:23S rRNA pseudouridine2457 synthase
MDGADRGAESSSTRYYDGIRQLRFMDRQFSPASGKTYIVFNKPYAVLSQFSVPENSEKPTLAKFDFPPDVYPVGRLDFDSEGLIVLSDDGRLNKALLDPERGHRRTYFAQVENVPEASAIRQLERGVVIEGQKTRPARVRLLESPPDLPPRSVAIRERKHIPTAWLSLTLTEGRNRQVRRMTAAVGCPTLRLIRVSIGELSLSALRLAPGEWRELSRDEIKQLFI